MIHCSCLVGEKAAPCVRLRGTRSDLARYAAGPGHPNPHVPRIRAAPRLPVVSPPYHNIGHFSSGYASFLAACLLIPFRCPLSSASPPVPRPGFLFPLRHFRSRLIRPWYLPLAVFHSTAAGLGQLVSGPRVTRGSSGRSSFLYPLRHFRSRLIRPWYHPLVVFHSTTAGLGRLVPGPWSTCHT